MTLCKMNTVKSGMAVLCNSVYITDIESTQRTRYTITKICTRASMHSAIPKCNILKSIHRSLPSHVNSCSQNQNGLSHSTLKKEHR